MNATSSTVQQATPQQVHDWLATGDAILIDVREPDEYAREHIKGAVLIPLSTFDPVQAASKARPGQRLVFHCRGGTRSTQAAQLAAAHAGSSFAVLSMTGGILAWKAQGLAVVTDTSRSRISILRQVQIIVGGTVLVASVLAWLVHPAFVALAGLMGAGLTFAGVSGTCGLAILLSKLPFNRSAAGGGESCALPPPGVTRG